MDGISIFSLAAEVKDAVTDGKIDKIYQPESDEIILSVRRFGESKKLLLTANPSAPKFHFTDDNKANPLTAPLFCMVMRKHLQGGRITRIEQPGLERIVNIYVENINEMGDYTVRKLILEIMGRHSNIILTDENNVIIECIKHITHDKSSVREVLPGREYVLPPSQQKADALSSDKEVFDSAFARSLSKKAQAMIYQSFVGISPVTASEVCVRAGIDPSDFCEKIGTGGRDKLYESFRSLIDGILEGNFSPCLIKDEKGRLIDFSPVEMKQFSSYSIKKYSSMSALTEDFYRTRDFTYRMNQKTQDLRKLVSQNIERCVRKKEIQLNTLKETENKDELRLWGELITSNIYSIKKGMTSADVVNFYSENQEILTIPLEGDKTPSENAQTYFRAYSKAKRTEEALSVQMKANDEEIQYLEAVLTSIGNCQNEQDVKEIRRELRENGYIKKTKNSKEKPSQKKSRPLHFISSDGYDIYVGKNNFQNDELTLKSAKPHDMWLHTKNIPGSHVIVTSKGKAFPDTTLTEAAQLAACFSKARGSSMVPVDYTEKKNVKKPNGAKPGMVIYETNKTAYVDADEKITKKLKNAE